MKDVKEITDADIAEELELREKTKESLARAKTRAAAVALENKKKPKKKLRLELEQRFLGRMISEANTEGDIRFLIERLSDEYGINWRRFIDKRHRALWRVLETMNMLSISERQRIIEEEAYAKPVEMGMNDIPEDDLVRGEPGSAADKQFNKKLEAESSKAIIWLERELDAADAFRLIGGKLYLRKIAEIGDKEWSHPSQLAVAMNEGINNAKLFTYGGNHVN